MSEFIQDNFLLQSSLAEDLYHNVVENLPIIDYHNHLDMKSLSMDKVCDNIAKLWSNPDPYKHRAMRINGVAEKYITGDASDHEKFLHWAKTVNKTIGNPLFHWSCLELKRCLGLDNYILTPENAQNIWDEYKNHKKSQLDILKKFNVEKMWTSNELFEDLSFHKSIEGCEINPSLRADSILEFNDLPNEVKCLDDYKALVVEKINEFEQANCKLSDHSLDIGFDFVLDKNPDKIFAKMYRGENVENDELINLKSHMLVFLGVEYAKRNWMMQLHVGAMRCTSQRLRARAGKAGGYAAIASACNIEGLNEFLNELEENDSLPRTILYNLNPADNAVFATLCGSYTGDGVIAKTQFGPAWWYNDHFSGINSHLETLSSFGLLSHFIGMTTDSRSVLSFSRHEYFRRILCNTIATWVKDGYFPNDKQLLKELLGNISYYNAKRILK